MWLKAPEYWAETFPLRFWFIGNLICNFFFISKVTQHIKPQILGHSAFFSQIHLISEKAPRGLQKTQA